VPVLKSKKKELYAQGICMGCKPRQAAEKAGISQGSIESQVSRFQRDPIILARIAELKQLIATATATTLQEVNEPVRVFVQAAIRERQYRVTVLQDLVDRLRLIITERADAYKDSGPGGASGLLVMQKKTLGTGPREVLIDELVADGVVIGQLKDILKQGAQEVGDWSDKHVLDTHSDAHPDLRGMTAEELMIERDALLQAQSQARQRIEALRASRQIEAAPGSVIEVSGDIVEGDVSNV
jgi:hypothetical protein